MQDFFAIIPEMFLASMAMLFLIAGAVFPSERITILMRSSMAALLLTFILLLQLWGAEYTALGNSFVSDNFTVFIKGLICLSAMGVMLLCFPYIKSTARGKFELPVLMMLSVTGMMVMVSAQDLIGFYVGLELQSLALYILAAFDRDKGRSAEAGLKYFVLGALSSGILLYGCSLIYGFTGNTHFDSLATINYEAGKTSVGLVFGLVLLMVGLCFKVSAVPFHMWTPDVYEGSPTPVTAFFAIAPKIAAIAVFIRIMEAAFGGMAEAWQQVIVVVSIMSMVLGAFAALKQSNIKRLLAYSSIGHVGYILMGVATHTILGIEAVLIYLVIYAIMSLGVFACILQMRRRGELLEKVIDFSGLAKQHPGFAVVIAILMFSMAGIPPLAGFFGKFFVFKAALQQEFYTLAVIGVLTSVVAAYYYLRIVKLMYFDDASEELDSDVHKGSVAIYSASAVFNVLFILAPTALLLLVRDAAIALFP